MRQLRTRAATMRKQEEKERQRLTKDTLLYIASTAEALTEIDPTTSNWSLT